MVFCHILWGYLCFFGYVTPCFQSKFPNNFFSLYGSKQKKAKSPLVSPFLWASISKRRTTSPRADITITVNAIKFVLLFPSRSKEIRCGKKWDFSYCETLGWSRLRSANRASRSFVGKRHIFLDTWPLWCYYVLLGTFGEKCVLI